MSVKNSPGPLRLSCLFILLYDSANAYHVIRDVTVQQFDRSHDVIDGCTQQSALYTKSIYAVCSQKIRSGTCYSAACMSQTLKQFTI